MKKHRHTINVLLIVFLVLTLVFLGVEMFWEGVVLEVRHYIGILFILATLVTLFINHNVFTLILGFTLLTGNFAGLSSFPEISTFFLGFHIASIPIPFYWGQPLYSLLLLIYVLANKEFFTGIATKKYWQDFTTRTNDLEIVMVSSEDKTNEKI